MAFASMVERCRWLLSAELTTKVARVIEPRNFWLSNHEVGRDSEWQFRSFTPNAGRSGGHGREVDSLACHERLVIVGS